jgi:hypothetical protein
MQNRYAADIGDYVKLAILRELQRGRTTGVLWWLYPDEAHNADGKHTTYLDRPVAWRAFDPPLFDSLRRLIAHDERSVARLQAADLLQSTIYFSEIIPTSGNAADRRIARQAWFARAQAVVSGCDLLFLDPDNGLETSRFDAGLRKAGKSVSLSELTALKRPGRAMVVYHHHTRMAGGNLVELAHWGERLAAAGFQVDALRAAVGTARAFFLLDASEEMRARAADLAGHWRGKLSWHPRLG